VCVCVCLCVCVRAREFCICLLSNLLTVIPLDDHCDPLPGINPCVTTNADCIARQCTCAQNSFRVNDTCVQSESAMINAIPINKFCINIQSYCFAVICDNKEVLWVGIW
jgi:hypothetical protein